MDLLAQAASPGMRRLLDFIAWTFLFVFTIALIWKIGDRLVSQFPGGEATMDLRIPHWPFLALLVAGLIMAAVMTLIRLWRVLKFGEGLEEHEALPREDRP